MNYSDSIGESSSKRQENGDGSTGSERPLKKARFAWQVKGKYHLKNESNELNKASVVLTNEPEGAGTSSETISNPNTLVGNTEQNLEILGDYLLKQDFNTLDSVITDTDKSLLTPSVNVSAETLQYPHYVSSYDNNKLYKNTLDSISEENNHVSVPMSMVVSNNYCEDQCIARWQARQMAKGFVDNTINRVLDSWIHRPLPPEMDNSRFLALDVAEFINNLPGDNSIENEGILMAISAHGLQNTPTSNSNGQNNGKGQNFFSEPKGDEFLSPPSTPGESTHGILDNNQFDPIETHSNDLSWLYKDGQKKSVPSDTTAFAFSPESSSNSYHNFNDSDSLHENYITSDVDDNMSENHFDFMDAAVSFAIQNKGLTTFGTDYG